MERFPIDLIGFFLTKLEPCDDTNFFVYFFASSCACVFRNDPITTKKVTGFLAFPPGGES